jgi:hypothetical protein
MGWTIGVLGFDSQRGLEIFLFTIAARTALGSTQPPIQWVPGGLSLGIKWPDHESDHSPPSSVQVKNAWSYTSTPQYAFMAWCLVKHRDNFTLIFLKFKQPQLSLIGLNKLLFSNYKYGKGKRCPFALTEHHAMKAYWGSGYITPCILDLGVIWR